MRLKGRRIYGIHAESTVTDGLYVNFGESRYGCITFQEFVENVRTWKWNISITDTEQWLPLLEHVEKIPHAFYSDPISRKLLEKMRNFNFIRIENNTLLFKDCKYSIKKKKFIRNYNRGGSHE